MDKATFSGHLSRSPHGERGLKYTREEERDTEKDVAPRTGSVD